MRSIPVVTTLAFVLLISPRSDIHAQRFQSAALAPAAAPNRDSLSVTVAGMTLADDEGDRKDPVIAGVFSALVPGLGSLYAGNNTHAIIHFGIHVAAYATTVGSFLSSFGCDGIAGCSDGDKRFAERIGATVLIGNAIWSVFTAVSDTHVHNAAVARRQGRVVGSLYFDPAIRSLHRISPLIGAPSTTAYQVGSIRF